MALACNGKHDPTLDERIRNVNAVGMEVDGTIYTTGRLELLILPLASDGSALLDPGFSAKVTVLTPAGLSARVLDKSCGAEPLRKLLAAGIAVDASSSMHNRNDPPDATGPAPKRKAALGAIFSTMQPGDAALLTDFSTGLLPPETPLRDLACAYSNPGAPATDCVPQATGFTDDTALLTAAMSVLQDFTGSPFYEACIQMVELLEARDGARRALLLLSDGLPHDTTMREACLSEARAANASIFTVGFGGAAEGPEEGACSAVSICPIGWTCQSGVCRYDHEAVLAMRELSQATGGAYAPATSPDKLSSMLARLGYTAGSCTLVVEITSAPQLAPGTPVELEVEVGTGGAKTTLEFLAPPP